MTSMNQTNNNHKAIVFDFGGVLVEWNPRLVYRKLFSSDEAVEKFLNEINFMAWNAEQDRGRPFAEGVAVLCAQFPQYTDLIRRYNEHWEESVPGPIQPVVNILRTLKQAGYPVYALSNWSAEKFKLIRPKYEFFNWLDDIVISGDVRLVKPQPQIFRVLLDRIGRAAHECVFIDDAEANVMVARQLGFHVIRYESPEQLKRDLAELEILRGNGFESKITA